MWRFQKPGFEALLLTELQRQQQCSLFCDTLLKTEGVSVPAHSCVLSAISPHLSSALSSTPPPPAGRSRLVEFGALGACSLLHLVRLLYSGEMAGEGEEEKREAISAAAMLGIHGLVEVTRGKSRNEDGGGEHVEVGVQAEPLMSEEKKGRWGGWRREERDGSTFLWKETLSDGQKDTWTQTEELQVNTAPPSCPSASFETIDMAVIQSLGQTDPHLLPFVPLSLICPLGETQTHQPSSAPVQESTAAGDMSVAAVAPPYASVPPPPLPCAADPQGWWTGPQRVSRDDAAAEEWEDKQFEQFHGNIPGYINHFLNTDEEEGSRGGRARSRRRAGGARGARTGERRPGRPRGRTAGRGRGGLTQTVDVQDVGVSRLHKLFQQRWGVRVPRTGQGGGAAGRKLHLKTRELLNSSKSCQRRRGSRKVWEVSLSGDVQLREGRAQQRQRGCRNTTQQLKQDNVPVVRARRARAKPTAPSVHHPASSLLHTTSIPPDQEQPEQFDRVLEEVMMGLHILPNQGQATFQSTQVVAAAGGADGSSSATSEVPVQQQQGEGELNDMLERFLQSFEQHIHSCMARDEVETGGQSCREASVKSSQITEQRQNDDARTPARPRRKTSSARSAAAPKRTEGTQRKARAKRQTRRTPERKRATARRPASSTIDAKNKTIRDRVDKQLQQTPVVELERSGPLPPRVTLQGLSRQHVEVKCPAKKKVSPSSVKCPRDRLNQPVLWKIYPLRSWVRRSHADSNPFLEEPLSNKGPPSASQPGVRRSRTRKNVQLLRLTNGESSTPPAETQPVDEQLEKNQKRDEEELTVQPQEEEAEGPTRRGKKRGAESEEETNDDAVVAKRVCFADLEPAATEIQQTIGVETVSLISVGHSVQKEGGEENPEWSEIKDRKTEENVAHEEMEIVDVDGEKDCGRSTRAPTLSQSVPCPARSEDSLGSTGDKDEDIDVIGGSSPVPDMVIIDWTESSEGEKEDEDVDVVGEMTDGTSSAALCCTE